ncbi:ubiquitinyl hydrolase [Aureococcus anophagefferens]|uniref:Ubiquitinyl hydrolase n=1 Tax=Aureococcus anophagefferens TaxID=44056 RepID=A0ABR1FI48_AURAN
MMLRLVVVTLSLAAASEVVLGPFGPVSGGADGKLLARLRKDSLGPPAAAASAQINRPTGLLVHGDRVFASEFQRNRVLVARTARAAAARPEGSGAWTVFADAGPHCATDRRTRVLSCARLDGAWGLAVHEDLLYVSSFGSDEILAFHRKSRKFKRSLTGDLDSPEGLAVGGDFLYVASFLDSRLVAFDLKRGGRRTLALGTPVEVDFEALAFVPGRSPFDEAATRGEAARSAALWGPSEPRETAAPFVDRLRGPEQLALLGNASLAVSSLHDESVLEIDVESGRLGASSRTARAAAASRGPWASPSPRRTAASPTPRARAAARPGATRCSSSQADAATYARARGGDRVTPMVKPPFEGAAGGQRRTRVKNVTPDLAVEPIDKVRRIFDVKTAWSAADSNYCAASAARGASPWTRASYVDNEYKAHAKQIDVEINGVSDGPMLRALSSLGGCVGLVFGQFSEASRSLLRGPRRMEPPEAQARLVADAEKAGYDNDTACLVNSRWLAHWRLWSSRDACGAPAPGAVDNACLLAGDGALQGGLTWRVHYDAVPEAAWRLLARWHGGGRRLRVRRRRRGADRAGDLPRRRRRAGPAGLPRRAAADGGLRRVRRAARGRRAVGSRRLPRGVAYCDDRCQRSHWSSHRRDCGRFAELNAAETAAPRAPRRSPRKKKAAAAAAAQRRTAQRLRDLRRRRGGPPPPRPDAAAEAAAAARLRGACRARAPLSRHFLSDGFAADVNEANPMGCGGRVAREYAAALKVAFHRGDACTARTLLRLADAGRRATGASADDDDDDDELCADDSDDGVDVADGFVSLAEDGRGGAVGAPGARLPGDPADRARSVARAAAALGCPADRVEVVAVHA